jgi:hypothetical protein
MTLLDVEELTAYWAEHPPVHILLAAYLGLSNQRHRRMPPARVDKSSSQPGERASWDIGSMLAELGSGFAAGDVHADLGPVVLDFTELRRKAAITVA